MGVGVSNGVEGILHALNRVIAKHDLPPDTVLLLIDFENAFNKVDRQHVIDQVWTHFPQIAGWVQYTYGTAASLFTGRDVLKASAGVQQGDPLGPLLFALVLQPLLNKLKETCGVELTSFLDDLTIVSSADTARECLDILILEGPTYGLTVSLAKTTVWWPQPTGCSTQQAPPGSQIGYDLFPTIIRSSANGVKLLGGAVSLTDSFFEEVAAERVRKAIESIDTMMELDDPQLCLMLLRACEGMKKLNYCWRTIEPRILRGLGAVMDSSTVNALRRICVADGPGFGDFQAMLASLPVTQCGGLGISLASDTSKFAYIASNLSSLEMQQKIFSSLPLVPTEVVSSLLESFEANASMDAVQSSDLQNQVKLPHKLQNYMARIYYAKKRQDLFQHNYLTDMPEDLRNRTHAVLQSVLEPIASQWLFALPNAGLSQHMNSNEFRAVISIRLLIPLFDKSYTCRAKGCKDCVMDKFGYHALSCRGAGNLCKARHDIVRDALYDIALQGNFNPVKDAPVQCMGLDTSSLRGSHLFRPADLLIRGNDFDRDCVDVTVSSPISKDMCLPEHFIVGASALQAEDAKCRKHLLPCEEKGYGFHPFALDIFGVIGPQSTDLLKRLCHSYQAAKGISKPLAFSICFRRISFSVQLGVARQLLPLLIFLPD
jgi:hypothetical protein